MTNTSFTLEGHVLFFSAAAKNVPEGTLEGSSSFCRLLLAARKAHRTMCQKVCRYHVHRLDVLYYPVVQEDVDVVCQGLKVVLLFPRICEKKGEAIF